MIVIAPIVEGHGEVSSVPILLRRISIWQNPDVPIRVLAPIRVPRDRFLNKTEDFRRYLLLAGTKTGLGGWIPVILDADFDCPATLAPELLARAQQIVPAQDVSIILANREYEAWFIASSASLHGKRRFQLDDPASASNAESIGNAKGWVKLRMVDGAYGETTDQPALTSLMDLEQAFTNSASFRKLCREWQKQVARNQ